jgi:nickel transport protein
VRLSEKYLLLTFCLVLHAPGAWSHGINLFATVEGTSIQGTLLYADGTPATKAPVVAYAPDGEVIAEATTDDTGRFVFEARVRVRHRLVGDAGQGHRGLFTIQAEDLPASLPDPDAALSEPVATDEPVAATSVTTDALSVDFDARLEAAVARQLRPLREQLDAYGHQVRIRDVMGGIGYLFGLVGLVVLLKERIGRRAD